MKSATYARRVKNSRETVGVSTVTFGSTNEPTPTLAATLMVVPTVPVAGLALILGIDRFMSEARALTNIVGNGVATIVIARWEGVLDRPLLNAELSAGSPGMLQDEPITRLAPLG